MNGRQIYQSTELSGLGKC